MIYFIFLSIFSLFIGINNVNAFPLYVVIDDDRLNYDYISEFVKNNFQFILRDVSYNLDDYNSYMFFDVGNDTLDNDGDYYKNYISGRAWGTNLFVESSNSSSYSRYFHLAGNSEKYNYVYWRSNEGNIVTTSSSGFDIKIPIYTKNVLVDEDVYLKVPSKLCLKLDNFCKNAISVDGDYSVVQIGWKNASFKGILNIIEDSKIIKEIDYTVNIYVDDKLNSVFSDTGVVGKTVTLKGLNDDNLKADENNNYEVVLVDGTNEFELRYYTSTYGTVYQQINTDNSELYLPFSYDKLKSMFPGINFELWTSYEQFNFVLTFNIFFVLFLIFIGYIILKMFYFLKGWFF